MLEPCEESRPGGDAVPFSQCNLWHAQRRFYQEQGVLAWNGKVPYQSTCNPVIANAYAHLIVRFLQDQARSGREVNRPVFLLELGSGPGLFGFYVVKRLLALLDSLGLDELAFVYVMSDFSERNIAFWRDHPALQDFVARGLLDFARYDIGTSRSIELLESGVVLEPAGGIGSPLIVLANYVFDTLPQDAFRVEGGRLFEGKTRGLPEGAALPELDNAPFSLEQLGISLELHEARLPHYSDAVLDGILERYRETLPDQGFLFPRATLLGLRDLLEIAGGHLLLVATDKANASHPPKISAETPDLVLHHASFSMMVNFHALGEYFAARGGFAIHQPSIQAITTSVFCLGTPAADLVETKAAIATFLHELGPADLNTAISQLQLAVSDGAPEGLMALLNLAQWDPATVNLHLNQIVAVAKTANADLSRSLAEGIRKYAEHFYYLPDAESALANAGIVFQEMRDYRAALDYYQRSLDSFGAEPADLYANTLYNMGLCHYYLGERGKALESFRHADKAAPQKDMMAKGWIYHLTVECSEDGGG
ncbi:MAG TPA: tetratricopeptide repeat protein [Thermoanaerobaculia bacterium]|nr:tetratricopeptide repeat protein [Thermoanaerobaculia bacterium]